MRDFSAYGAFQMEMFATGTVTVENVARAFSVFRGTFYNGMLFFEFFKIAVYGCDIRSGTDTDEVIVHVFCIIR